MQGCELTNDQREAEHVRSLLSTALDFQERLVVLEVLVQRVSWKTSAAGKQLIACLQVPFILALAATYSAYGAPRTGIPCVENDGSSSASAYKNLETSLAQGHAGHGIPLAEQILSASERIEDQRPVHWISTN